MALSKSRAAPALDGPHSPAQARRVGWLSREAQWVACIVVLALVITSLPYLYAYQSSPSDQQFVGFMLGVDDHAQYFSWMRDLSTQPLAGNRLTSEPNDPALFNLLWWGAGRFSVGTGLSFIETFAVLRVLAVVTCLLAMYAILRVVIADPFQRRLALLIATFGSGLGFVWVVVKYALRLDDAPYPLDTHTAEANSFLLLLGFPHFALALGLLTATFTLILISLRRHSYWYAVAAGGVALVLGLQHAYDLITIYAVLGLFGALLWLRDRRFPRRIFFTGLIIAGCSAPPAAYLFLLVNLNPVWREVLEQFHLAGVFTPHPLHLLVLLGIPFLLALLAFRPRMLQSRDDGQLLVAVWFVTPIFLVYLPVDFQIHLLLGWQLPIAVLAADALVHRVTPFVRRFGRVRPRHAVLLIVFLTFLTNIYLWSWRFVELARHEEPFYLTNDEVAALDWLGAHASRSDVVLAELEISRFVPGRSDARVVVGHWANTLEFPDKQRLVAEVLSPTEAEREQLAVLRELDVTYVLVRETGDAQPSWTRSPYALEAFSAGELTIYRVQGAE